MRQVIIEADFAVGGRPLCLEPVYYPSLLAAYAAALRGGPPLVALVPESLRAQTEAALNGEGLHGRVRLVDRYDGSPEDVRFRIDQVYDPKVVRDVARTLGKALPSALWTIREEHDISRAAATLERLDSYPIARHTVVPTARRLALALRPTVITPNMLTTASCVLGVAAGLIVFLPGWLARVAAFVLIHVSMVLDFSDGYLARLRGVESKVGYWLDTTLDEVVKFSLLLAMGGLILRDGPRWALWPAVLVVMLSHVLTCSHWLTMSLTGADVTYSRRARAATTRSGAMWLVQRVFNGLTQLDVFLYFMALAFLLSLESVAVTVLSLNYALRLGLVLRARVTTGAF